MTKVHPKEDSPQVVDMYEKYEKEIVKKRHNCTDIICLILFLIFIIAQVILSILIYVNPGDPKNLLLPHDSDGNLCSGSTPYLFYFNLVECISVTTIVTGCTTPTICVSDCPSDNYYYLIPNHRDKLFPKYCVYSKLSAYYSGNIPSLVNEAAYTSLVNARICPIYTLSSKQIYGRCLPSFLSTVTSTVSNLTASDTSTNTTMQISDLTQPLTDQTISKAVTYIMNLINLKGILQYILEDFVSSYIIIILLLVIGAVASFIYILILRWILAPIIYITLVAVVGALAFVTYYCITKYLSLKDNSNQTFQFTSDFSYYLTLSYTWLAFGIISGVILIIILLILLVLFKRLRFAIQIICEASKAVSSVFLTLIFPIIPLALELGFLAYFIVNAVLMACSGQAIFKVANATNSSSSVGDSCSPSVSTAGAICVFYKYGYEANSALNSIIAFLNTYQYVPQLFNIFMMFWVEAFVVGFNQMVLAGCFGIWYWSKSRSPCILFTSIKDTLVYHMGSIAFGSLLIAICKFLRFLIELVEKRVKKATGNNSKLNCLISFIACCCKCCFWCLEKFLKFINRNAYIMVAIYGRNFCMSAKDALTLLITNPLRALVLDRVTDFLLFLGRLLITAGVGVLGFYFFSKSFYITPILQKYLAPDLHYYWVPLIVVIIGTYFIAKTFLTVFEMAIDTVFLCALKDLDIHDGSPEKPYYMSTKMLKILSVKNKEPEPKPAEPEPSAPVNESTKL